MRVLWFKIYPGGIDALQPAESEETDAGAADGSDEAEQETTEQQSADTKKKKGRTAAQRQSFITAHPVEQKS